MTLDPAASEVAGPQAEAAVTPRPTPVSAPPVLHDEQRRLLRAALNRIIPARANVPGAGDLDVGTSIERSLAASARLRRLLVDGLQEIAIASQRLFGVPFVDLGAEAQTSVLERVEHRSPAFLAALVEHTYRGYYTLPEVHRAIGYESRPPQPLGHTLPPFDPALLDFQRQRAPFWRRT